MPGALWLIAWRHVAFGIVEGRTNDIAAGAIAIVEHVFAFAITIDVEHLTDMSKRVPLRRVLQRQDHLIVAYDVGGGGIVAAKRIIHVWLFATHRWLPH